MVPVARSPTAYLSALTWLPEFNVAIFAWLLNYPWEFLQAPLFAGMASAPYWEAVKTCSRAALGDAVLMTVAYWTVAAFARNRRWIAAPSAGQIVLLLAVTVSIATGIEWLALRGLWFQRWAYAAQMPLVPGLGIGLVPLLQWLLLPLLIVAFVRRQLAGARVR